MNFVEQNVHQRSKEEGQPANHDHHPDLELCQGMNVTIHINQLHTVRYTGLYRHSEPKKKALNIFKNLSIYEFNKYPRFRAVNRRK